MTNSEIFHNETISLGGRFQRERASEYVQRVYTEIEESAQGLIRAAQRILPNLPQIHFDFIFNGEINAVAFRSDERYFIGCYTGILFMLDLVVGRMLSDSRIFKFVGDPKSERSDLGPMSHYIPDAKVMHKKEAVLIPNDKIRRVYSIFLRNQAFLFFVGHELTHIVHGHVDYLRAKRGQKVTTELGWFGERNQEELIERQCIEADADRRSVQSRIDSLRVAVSDSDTPIFPWHSKAPLLIFADWALSLNILFRLFGDLRFSHTEPAQSPYPPLPLRRVFCEATALETMSKIWGPKIKTFAIRALYMARNEADLAFATMTGEEVRHDREQFPMPKADTAQGARLESYWNSTLMALLKPYSYEL